MTDTSKAASAPEVFGDDLVLELRSPIQIGEMVYTSIELSEPTGAQLVAAGKAASSFEGLLVLINLNGKVPLTVVNQMRQRDLQRAGDFFGHFAPTDSSSDSAITPQS